MSLRRFCVLTRLRYWRLSLNTGLGGEGIRDLRRLKNKLSAYPGHGSWFRLGRNNRFVSWIKNNNFPVRRYYTDHHTTTCRYFVLRNNFYDHCGQGTIDISKDVCTSNTELWTGNVDIRRKTIRFDKMASTRFVLKVLILWKNTRFRLDTILRKM